MISEKKIRKNENVLLNIDKENMTFKYIQNKNYIYKSTFLNNSINDINNKNILCINYDTQGINWKNYDYFATDFNARLKAINKFEISNTPIRESLIENDQEKNLKKLYKKSKKYDIFYGYNKFIKLGKTYIPHLQIRKNLFKINQYLIYSKKYSIELYDIILNKQQPLITFENDDETGIICFDVKIDDNNIFLCLGNTDGSCKLYKVNFNDFKIKLHNKFNNDLTKYNDPITIEKEQNDEDSENNDDEEDLEDSFIFSVSSESKIKNFINYVKFIDNSKLITTSNDKTFKIYDLNKINIYYNYKNNFPVNHCDLNKDKNIALLLGDSYSINIVDFRCKKLINKLKENYDFGIVIKFNQYNENYFASGNQDYSCKIWDIRNLSKGSIYTSWGICEGIGDLDWISENKLCYNENILYSHILDIYNYKIQDLCYCGFSNGVVHDNINKNIFINLVDSDEGGILVYESLKKYIKNSFNNININF